MDVHFNINDVFTKNKVLIVKEMEKSLAERKQFIDKSIQHVINNNEKAFISPILYDVLISMIYKSTNRTFCDDIDPSNTLTYDVDGSKKLCFRFGELTTVLKRNHLTTKITLKSVKTAGVEVCAWNVLPMLLMDILL